MKSLASEPSLSGAGLTLEEETDIPGDILMFAKGANMW